jgi:drug/metabolite transporter (DMT)-like permease
VRVESRHALAVLALIAACVCWGLSFPFLKAVMLHQGAVSGQTGGWITVQNQLVRFLGAAVLLFAFAWWRTRRLPSRAEWAQSAICAVSAALGLFLQIDALNHTAASTVGFLTQCYVIALPVVAGLAARRWPSVLVVVSVVLAFGGVAILSGVTPDDLRPGLGELMTIAASLVFMGQILALGAERWRGNDGLQVTWLTFAIMTALMLPFAALTGPGLAGMPACYREPAALAVMAAVIVVCTCIPYALMAVWQRFVSGTEAGVIYCSEAVFTAIASILLPALLAGWLGVAYAGETVTWRMVLGGGLIITGCLLVQKAAKPTH